MTSQKDPKQSNSLLLDDLLSGDQTVGLLNAPTGRGGGAPRPSSSTTGGSPTSSPLMADALKHSANVDALVDRISSGPQTGSSSQSADPNSLTDTFIAQSQADLEVDAAVRAAAHTVKVLGPLMSAITKWIDPNTDIDRTTHLMQNVLSRVRVDAQQIATAMNVPADVSPAWLTSQISGYLMPIFVNGINRGNGSITDVSTAAYLIPFMALADNAKNIAVAGIPDTSLEWNLSVALASATSEVMLEYSAFSYFINDQSRVAETVSEFLADRILKGTLSSLSESFDLHQAEKKQLGTVLLQQAGSILAECWEKGIPSVLNEMKLLPIEERHEIIVEGYPLDTVFKSFENIYQGIEIATIASIRALSPGRENHNNTPTPGQRIR